MFLNYKRVFKETTRFVKRIVRCGVMPSAVLIHHQNSTSYMNISHFNVANPL